MRVGGALLAALAALAMALPAGATAADVSHLRGFQSSSPSVGPTVSLPIQTVSQEPNQVWVLMLVMAPNAQATAVSYRGQPYVRQIAQTSTVGRIEIWTLTAPNTGAAPGQLTFQVSATTPIHLAHSMYAGTDPVRPVGSSGGSIWNGSAASASLAFPAPTGEADLLLGVLAGTDAGMTAPGTTGPIEAPFLDGVTASPLWGSQDGADDGPLQVRGSVRPGATGAGFAWRWGNGFPASPYAAVVLGLRAPTAPTVEPVGPIEVTETSASIGGRVVDDGGFPILGRGVVLCASPCTPVLGAPGMTVFDAGSGPEGATFRVTATALQHSTDYTYRAFANNLGRGNLAYSPSVTFATAHNFPPQITVAGALRISEGQSLTPAASAFDPDGDPLTVSWDLDGDGEYDDALGLTPLIGWPRLNALGLDGPADRNIFVRVTDQKHPPEEARIPLRIDNAPPTGVLTAPTLLSEGEDAPISFTAVDDPSTADEQAGIRYGFDFDNNGSYEVGSGRYQTAATSSQATIPGSFFDGPSQRTVRGVIIDRNEGVTTVTRTITVFNVPPTLTVADTTVPESGTATVRVTDVVDPSDRVRFAYDLDGQPGYEIGSLEFANASTQTSATVPAERVADGPGSFTVAVAAVDDDGAVAPRTATVTVENVAPTATLAGSTATEGTPATASFTGASDPSPADRQAGFTYAWDVDGDGTFTPGGASAAVPAQDGPATVSVAGEIRDRDGAGRRYTTTVQFTNAPPKAVITGPAAVAADGLVTLEVDVSDPGGDPVSALLDWGDGNTQLLAAGHSIVQHVYPRPGAQTVAVVPRDDDGAYGATASHGVSVAAPPAVIEAPKPDRTPVPAATPAPTPVPVAPAIDQAISGVRLTPSCLRRARVAVRFVLKLAGDVDVSLTRTSSKRPRTCPRPRGSAPPAGHRIGGVYTPRPGRTVGAREGANTLTVAATGRNGKRLSPGTYRVRIRAGVSTADAKLVVLAPVR